MKGKKFIKKCILSVLVLSLLCAYTIKEVSDPDDYISLLDDIYYNWVEENINSEDATNKLNLYLTFHEQSVVNLAKKYINTITIEDEGDLIFKSAQDAYYDEEYAKCMKLTNNINDQYTRKDKCKELYDICKEIVLLETSQTTSIEECEESITYLENIYIEVEDSDIKNRIEELNIKIIHLNESAQYIHDAKTHYKNKSYKESIELLNNAVKNHPRNEILKDMYDSLITYYKADVFNQVEELCNNKKSKEAIKLLEESIEEYKCEEFELLLEKTKEDTYFLYKLKNNITRFLSDTFKQWEEEEYTINDIGEYIGKSSEKLVLGDYSEENITVLSAGTNILAAILNLDLFFDLRDLSYDIVNWNEGEYFAFRIAADCVALIPVIGVVKYCKLFNKTDDITDAAKTIDNISDVVKESDRLADTVDHLSDTLKTTESLDEVIKTVTKNADTTDDITDSIKNVKTGYTRYLETPNCRLKGQRHEITGVLFKEKTVKFSKQDDLVGVFPVFESKFDYKLSEDLWLKSDDVQFRRCNKNLYEAVENDLELKKSFTKQQLEQLSRGETPKGYVWHHNEEEGVMQLVDEEIHRLTGHTGGRYLWGGGAEYR